MTCSWRSSVLIATARTARAASIALGACSTPRACSFRRVERSLSLRANGYSYDAVKIFMPAGPKQPVVVHYTEHCPPDVGAAFIWLKNRDPDRWRDVPHVEHVLG